MSKQLEHFAKNMKDLNKTALREEIEKLPISLQLTVDTCFKAGTVPKNLRRYSLEWLFQCILMRIKSRKCYDHMRSRFILPLPCSNTIDRYINTLDCDVGFKDVVLETMKFKGENMQAFEKQGIILADQMFFCFFFSNIKFYPQNVIFSKDAFL